MPHFRKYYNFSYRTKKYKNRIREYKNVSNLRSIIYYLSKIILMMNNIPQTYLTSRHGILNDYLMISGIKLGSLEEHNMINWEFFILLLWLSLNCPPIGT